MSLSSALRVIVSILIGAGLVAGGVAVSQAMVAASLKAQPDARAPGQPPLVRVIEVAPMSHREQLLAYGRARALRRVMVAAESSGRLTWLASGLEAGAEVAAGAPLARIDSALAEAALAEARAAVGVAETEGQRVAAARGALEGRLAVAREELATRRSMLARAADLLDKGAGSKASRDSALTALQLARQQEAALLGQLAQLAPDAARAEASLARARVGVKTAELRLERCSVAAPFAGVIVSRAVSLGAWVNPGEPLLELLDPSAVELALALPARARGEIDVGARVQLERQGGEAIEARVSRLASRIVPGDETFTCYVELRAGEPAPESGQPQPPARAPLAAGELVSARLDGLLHQQVLVVPREALIGEEVLVAVGPAAEARLERRRLRLVRRLATVVLAALPPEQAPAAGEMPWLAAGEQLVVEGQERLGAGSRVRHQPRQPPR